MFEGIQEAYELLLPVVESGQKIKAYAGNDSENNNQPEVDSLSAHGFAGGAAQLQTIQLLIKTQSMICRRFEKEMGKYKYPAYRMLLSCLNIPSSSPSDLTRSDTTDPILKSCLMSPKRAEFVRYAVELVFRTCLVSPLNAEELVAESGVPILESLLDFYLQGAHSIDNEAADRIASDFIVREIISYLVHTIAGISYYENGRLALLTLPCRSRLCINWRRCLDGNYLGRRVMNVGDSLIKKYAIEGIINMARHQELQSLLIGSGVVWPLVKYLLSYDPTLDRTDSLDDDIGISQAASNTQARLATRALGMLCGCLLESSLSTPRNDKLLIAMNKLLTGPVALMLRNKRPGEILRTLNANIESPARIWNVGMRDELLKFLERMEQERPEDTTRSVDEELKDVQGFSYTALKDELQIGGVYVRVFDNIGSDREILRDIQNPTLFAEHVTAFIARSINKSEELPEGWVKLETFLEKEGVKESDFGETVGSVPIRDRRFVMAISALKILVRVDGLVDDVLSNISSGVPSVLLSLLELPQDSEVGHAASLGHWYGKANCPVTHGRTCL